MSVRDLLIEIGTEELPPKALKKLANTFAEVVFEELKGAELQPAEFVRYASPRRLAVWVKGVRERQEDREVTKLGPALQAAFDEDGKPTKALEGFARSCGVDVDALEEFPAGKVSKMGHRYTEPGKSTAELVPGIVDKALEALPIPKRMRWGDSAVEFVRPVHWVVMLFGDEIIPAEVLGCRAGRESRGHRFHHPHDLYLLEPAAYAPLLETEGHVIVDFEARREAVKAQAEAAAVALGGHAVIDEELLDEVTALVEWPVAVSGNFERNFLEVPQEALISTMQDNQKYFPVVDGEGKLMPHFITISNIDSRDVAQVREGNERVIRPRFADAMFFWQQDRKQPLSARAAALESILFQKDLGTLADKTARIRRLAGQIAGQTGADRALAERAAELAKCDLMTDMVFEFTDLQGVMGRYYALHDGEPAAVAEALDEQYMPRHAGDDTPPGQIGQILALADKIDTLMGIFAIGQKPTGAKDPFALRRAALGVLRIMIERGLELDLRALFETAAEALADRVKVKPGAVDEVFDFVTERLRAYYLDRGVRPDVFDAVAALRPTRPLDFDRRIRAVSEFQILPQAEALAAANKRIQNILRKAEEAVDEDVDTALLQEAAEQQLAASVAQMAGEVAPLFEAGDYEEALKQLAGLREDVDRFFDEVMVMAEDAAVRRNRLALLNRLGGLFMRAADISRLQG